MATRILTKTSAAIGLVEAAHDGSGDWQAWCQRLQDAARLRISLLTPVRSQKEVPLFSASADDFMATYATANNKPSEQLSPAERSVSVMGVRRKLTVRGKVWIVEWIPGGCSDWYSSVELRFAGGRVVSTADNSRSRYTGVNCI